MAVTAGLGQGLVQTCHAGDGIKCWYLQGVCYQEAGMRSRIGTLVQAL